MTTENKPQTKKSFSLDWLVGGVLTKLGDTFDRLTGRGWNPSSSLATSKLIEKLKFLLDSEVRDLGNKGKFVPHVIKLKIQWDKFSTESENELDKLKYELHAAAIDHINDKLYHTYAPLDIEIKTDYFTEGVKMLSSFGKYSDKEDDEVSVNVTVPKLKVDGIIADGKINVDLTEQKIPVAEDIFIARYIAKGKAREVELNFTINKRIAVGRTGGNQITIDDTSVSKIHAALVLNNEKYLMVADTGSTNGTFINGQRIAYGKAVMFEDDAKVKFGTVEVTFERLEAFVEEDYLNDASETEVGNKMQETQANVDLSINEPENIPPPTHNNIEQIQPEISKPDATLQFEAENINPQKTVASIKPTEEEPGQKTEENNSVEENKLKDTDNSENVSEVINLDNTQDWEV